MTEHSSIQLFTFLDKFIFQISLSPWEPRFSHAFYTVVNESVDNVSRGGGDKQNPTHPEQPTHPLRPCPPRHTAHFTWQRGAESRVSGGPWWGVANVAWRFPEMALSHVSVAYFPKCHMSNLRNDHVKYHFIFSPHVTCHWALCRIPNLNAHVPLSILGVKGHSLGLVWIQHDKVRTRSMSLTQ